MKFINKIVLGTMKLKKYFNNSKDLSIFLDYAHEKGIKQIHISSEYDSYNLIKKSLKKIKQKKFSFILKLAEPKTDKNKFNLRRFKKKIYQYRKDLGPSNNFTIQLVNRYQCNNNKEYLIYQQSLFDKIKRTIVKLKKIKVINNFYFFPYHKERIKIKKRGFIDGITCYRNINEKHFDNFAKKNKFEIIAMRTFGGNNKIIKKDNLKRLIQFNLKNKIVKKVIVGINNKERLNQLMNVC